jgi:hypothetical protein
MQLPSPPPLPVILNPCTNESHSTASVTYETERPRLCGEDGERAVWEVRVGE